MKVQTDLDQCLGKILFLMSLEIILETISQITILDQPMNPRSHTQVASRRI